MDKKCSKYEGLFTFSDEKTLLKHVQECEECREEHEKMEKVSELLGEVKFYYRSKNKRKAKLRAVCAAALIFMTMTFGYVIDDEDLLDTLKYGDTLTAEELGFPVDSYGLVMVDDGF